MSTPQTLEKQLYNYYLRMIREKKINFKDISEKLPYMVRDKIINLLIEDARCDYLNNHYQDLKTELLVATAKKVEIYEDMRLVHHADGQDRELVRDIYIRFKEPRQMFAILDTDEYEEEDDINMMSNNREDLKCYTEYGDEIVEIFVDFYKQINEYEHPAWEQIYKFVENHCGISDDFIESLEQYCDF